MQSALVAVFFAYVQLDSFALLLHEVHEVHTAFHFR